MSTPCSSNCEALPRLRRSRLSILAFAKPSTGYGPHRSCRKEPVAAKPQYFSLREGLLARLELVRLAHDGRTYRPVAHAITFKQGDVRYAAVDSVDDATPIRAS